MRRISSLAFVLSGRTLLHGVSWLVGWLVGWLVSYLVKLRMSKYKKRLRNACGICIIYLAARKNSATEGQN